MHDFSTRSFADAYFAIWNERRVDQLARFVSADVRYRDVALGLTIEGLVQVQDFMKSLFLKFPDVEWHTVDTITETPDKFVIQWITHRTLNGERNTTEGISVVRRVNGLIAENVDYRDRSRG